MDNITISFARTAQDTKKEASGKAGVKLIVDSISGHQVIMRYETIVGNCPQKNGNQIHIWMGDGVKWGTEPKKSFPIPSDDQDGQIIIDGVTVGKNSFTIGYSVGASPEQTVASVTVPQGVTDPEECEYSSVEITGTAVNDSTVSFKFEALEGYTPNAHAAWVAIWERKRVPYPASNWMGKTIIRFDFDEGDDVLRNLEMAAGQDYCIGFFQPKTNNGDEGAVCLAASYTFKY